jgi:hypothetical protein
VKARDIEDQHQTETGEKLGNRAVPAELSALGCKPKRLPDGRVWITPKGLAAGLTVDSSPAEVKKAYAS